MKAKGYFKEITGERFYTKKIKGGYWGVYNRLDMSLESLCISKEEAKAECEKLNGLRK